jgi:hypothetical protein
MKMETVEHFAQIALVTHLLGRQQPLEGEDLEKLKLARSKYQGANSVVSLACSTAGNHHERPQNVSQLESTIQPRGKHFRSQLKTKG